jgi:hypothetical protein
MRTACHAPRVRAVAAVDDGKFLTTVLNTPQSREATAAHRATELSSPTPAMCYSCGEMK